MEILREKHNKILLREFFLQIPKGRYPKNLPKKRLSLIFYDMFQNFLLGFIITLLSLTLFRLGGKFFSHPLMTLKM